MKSIIQKEKECYLCGSTLNLEKHHCIHGTAGRKLADKYGLTVWLCAYHHRDQKNGVHGNKDLTCGSNSWHRTVLKSYGVTISGWKYLEKIICEEDKS